MQHAEAMQCAPGICIQTWKTPQ